MRADEEQNTPAEKSRVYDWTPHELKYLSQVITPRAAPHHLEQKRGEGRVAVSQHTLEPEACCELRIGGPAVGRPYRLSSANVAEITSQVRVVLADMRDERSLAGA